MQTAVCDYVRRERSSGRPLASIVETLKAGGMPRLTLRQVEDWMRGAVDEDRELRQGDDPFGGEPDEARRARGLKPRPSKLLN